MDLAIPGRQSYLATQWVRVVGVLSFQRARALSNAFNKLPASYRRINPSERLLENDMGHMESLLVARSY